MYLCKTTLGHTMTLGNKKTDFEKICSLVDKSDLPSELITSFVENIKPDAIKSMKNCETELGDECIRKNRQGDLVVGQKTRMICHDENGKKYVGAWICVPA